MRSDSYIGWIPNVAGRLSYSHIGDGDFPSRCEVINFGDHLGRRIVAVQRRRLSDWLLPNWYFKFLYGFSANWRCLMVAQTASDNFDQIAQLTGEILLFDDEDWRALDDTWSSGYPASIAERCQTHLAAWARGNVDAGSAEIDALVQEVRSRAICSFDFMLRRSGVVWLKPKHVAIDLKFSQDYADDVRRPNQSDEQYLTNQAFFFLKDISHVHRHHPKSSDTITEAGQLDVNKTWAIDCHYRIHGKVVEMRRSNHPSTMYNATGMLAYLGALRKAAKIPQGDHRRGPLTYNNAEIESSIKSSLEVIKWKQTQYNIIKTALPALLIGLMAALGYDAGSPGEVVKSAVLGFYADRPLQFLSLSLFLIPVALVYYEVVDLMRLRPILHAKRILVAFSARRSALFWFFGGLVLAVSAAGQLMLSSILDQFGRGWTVDYRLASAAVLVLTTIISGGAIYGLPFIATRRDLLTKFGRLLSR